MRTFERQAVGNVIGMTNAERLVHVAYYRCRARELQEMRGAFLGLAPETLAALSADIAAIDRMASIFGDSLAQDEPPAFIKPLHC